MIAKCPAKARSWIHCALAAAVALSAPSLWGDPREGQGKYRPKLGGSLGEEIENTLDPRRAEREAKKTTGAKVVDGELQRQGDDRFASKHHLDPKELEAYQMYKSYRELRELHGKLKASKEYESLDRVELKKMTMSEVNAKCGVMSAETCARFCALLDLLRPLVSDTENFKLLALIALFAPDPDSYPHPNIVLIQEQYVNLLLRRMKGLKQLSGEEARERFAAFLEGMSLVRELAWIIMEMESKRPPNAISEVN